MPGKIKVKILAGRNLPVMDRSGDTTDAYVEIKFGNTTYKTDVCRKSLNPQWNSEWYRFEVDDAELQDEPLQVRLMDHDTYSANDAIGKVYVNLNPLLLPGLPPTVKNIWTLEATMNSSSGSQGGCVMTGWIPVFDTMHGIRGEVNIIVKVELFSDCNKFRQSSCGVQFFYSPNIPYGYHAQVIHGFVEELVVSDDPEYKWIDKIRTPRASNEARQTLFFKLSGEVQRKIGLKALDLGGNAVIGYVQNFDLEGESGIVARGIGTAVTLVKLQDISAIIPLDSSNVEELTCFRLQYKNQLDFSESDDSLPLLSHSPNHSPIPRSPTNLHATTVSQRFPKYERTPNHPRQVMRLSEYRAAGLRTRQLSLQHNAPNSPMKKTGVGSSLSLADDLISESSLRNMLALEDMRGEPAGNPFSRGLKNFRYLHQNILPRRVAQIKSKITDSFDDESDPDSTYSSTWSLAGSESTRSSIADIRQSIRRKKFTHRKTTNEGIAALLIRSVHSGLPLDSVREDRETPTPSPVHFLPDFAEYGSDKMRQLDDSKGTDSSCQSTLSRIDENFGEDTILMGKKKRDVKYTNDHAIPMISSSETDTSTSDDEPSESSTNYNILDDTYSVMDPSSPDDRKFNQNFCKSVQDENLPDLSLPALNSSSPLTTIADPEKIESGKDYVEENLMPIPILDRTIASLFTTDETPIVIEENLAPTSLSSSSMVPFLPINQISLEIEENILSASLADLSLAPLLSSDEISPDIEENRLNTLQQDPSAAPLLGTSPISYEIDENVLDCLAPNSPSTPEELPKNSKIKLLKFLPKQKKIDGTEDATFVTSTPLQTDVTFIPKFESEEISPSPEIDESSKFDVVSSISSSAVANIENVKLKADAVSEESFSKDLFKTEKSFDTEECVTYREKQVCPLGVPFDKITIANEIKSATLPATDKVQSVETENSSTPVVIGAIPKREVEALEPKKLLSKKAERQSKKVERSDTVIYKGPAKEKERYSIGTGNRDVALKMKNVVNPSILSGPIPIVVAPPPEEHATRLQVPVIQTTIINVQSTYTPDEMKTQHFGSIGSRKFPIDECAISDKFNRKYRQHCMLDLIKTIDAKMMVHHMHHERRDSTKSKKKKRERMNASVTPSPDSIRRTRSHKRRSRSRSPERQHTHSKGQVSSLSTHSYPNSASSQLKSPFVLQQDSPSCDSSYENLTKNNIVSQTAVCPKDSSTLTKEIAISPSTYMNDSDELKIDKEPATDLITKNSTPDILYDDIVSNNEIVLNEAVGDSTNSMMMNLLVPGELNQNVHKSHSADSLEMLRERLNVTTKITNTANTSDDLCVPCSPISLRQQDEQSASSPVQTSSAFPASLGSKVTPNSSTTNKTNTNIPNMHRRSSDSDLSITPKGNSLAGSDRSTGGHLRPSTAIVRTMNQDTMEMLEYPFITMQQYPPGFVLNIGGLVSARSVKLLERITNLEEPEGRDAWWTEIRMEVRSHARALACNVVLGYKEEISISDDVCVLNASGTAAVINLLNANQDQDNVQLSRTIMTTSVESERDKTQVKTSNVKSEKSEETSVGGQQIHSTGKTKRTSESNDHEVPYLPAPSACSICHLPYSEASVPFRVDVSKCAICRRAKVPDVLFTTIELPENIPMTGRGVFLQATVCKCKRDLRGELNAKEISDCLPFLEYELHSLLLNKLKVKGMNAIFGLKVQVSVGERLVIGMAVGTAVYLTALPTPSVPQIASGNSWHNEEQLAEIQKTLIETVKKNREFYRLKPIVDIENGRSVTTSDTDESDDDLLPDLDLGIGTKDACVLEVDDVEDMDRINLLMDERPPDDFHVVNTQSIPGLEDLEIVRNLQMFTQISRAKIPAGQFASMPSKYFARMLQTVLFKLRRMVPCALCDMQFKVALPEQDEIQLSVVGMALGLGEPTRFSKYKRKLVPNSQSKDPIKKTEENDMIFSLDEDQTDNTTGPLDSASNQSNSNVSNSSPLTGLSTQRHRPRSPYRTRSHMQHRHKHMPLKERYGVDITPLSYLPGGKIERYLGNLNFFFIRESTSIRENGGLSGFTHSFVTEILAIVRAHITALGGNAMVAFFMTQCVLLHSPHKNQGQCLINVGGDVVTVSYYGDDKYQTNQNC